MCIILCTSGNEQLPGMPHIHMSVLSMHIYSKKGHRNTTLDIKHIQAYQFLMIWLSYNVRGTYDPKVGLNAGIVFTTYP